MKGYRGFADLIRKRRKDLGLRLDQVAERTGLSVPYLSELERGAKQPPQAKPDVLQNIARALDLDLRELTREALLSRNSVEIYLEGANAAQRQAALLLARRFERGLTEEETQRLLQALGGDDELEAF